MTDNSSYANLNLCSICQQQVITAVQQVFLSLVCAHGKLFVLFVLFYFYLFYLFIICLLFFSDQVVILSLFTVAGGGSPRALVTRNENKSEVRGQFLSENCICLISKCV